MNIIMDTDERLSPGEEAKPPETSQPEMLERKNRRMVGKILRIFFLGAALFVSYRYGFYQGHGGSVTATTEAGIPLDSAVFSNTDPNGRNIDFALFWKVWDILKEKYVDRAHLDAQKLFYGAIKGMLAATGDSYTTFFDPEEQKSFNEDMSGKFEGIGAEMGIRDEVLTIIAPLDGAPAELAGLRPNDKILKIDGEKTTNLSLEEAVAKIRGQKGTNVTLTIFREGEEESRDVSVTRDVINVKSVKFTMRDDGIAVLRVSRFGDETDGEYYAVVTDVVTKNPKGIILDLRSNPGGLLNTAVSIASLMLPADKTVVIEENGKGERKTEQTLGGDKLSGIPTVVLIDEGSASASEILAGALRENREDVVLVGKKSYGKGSVQELIPVGKDVSVKVTIARWLTPNGNQINEKGITPDDVVNITLDDIKAGRDPQLDKAAEKLNGRT
ncbi:MAG: S41 family peptidase [Candidatus Moranbacteria bacterium]|nr:S41 family peptidase [Candidatus Moranbacteria bacterium]